MVVQKKGTSLIFVRSSQVALDRASYRDDEQPISLNYTRCYEASLAWVYRSSSKWSEMNSLLILYGFLSAMLLEIVCSKWS